MSGVFRASWINQDALRSLERWQYIIEREPLARTDSWPVLVDGPSGDQDWEPMPFAILFADSEDLGWHDRLRYLLSSDPFAITDLLARKTFLFQTQQQMVVTTLALHRYRIRHGVDPPSLDKLIPELLPKAPKDWMDGKPLRYRLQPGGGFLLYSVGENAEDDGGDPSPHEPNRKYRQPQDGKDAVWPVAAGDEEARIGGAIAPPAFHIATMRRGPAFNRPERPNGSHRASVTASMHTNRNTTLTFQMLLHCLIPGSPPVSGAISDW